MKNNWSYPNHYQMKQNRLIKMSQVKWKCERCGKKAKYVHHKDKSKNNHELNNLMAVCMPCHLILHNIKKDPNYMKQYYQKNKTEILRKLKIYLQQNKEKIYSKMRKYQIKNKKKLLHYGMLYRRKIRALKKLKNTS